MTGYVIPEFTKCRCEHEYYMHLSPIGFRYSRSPCVCCSCRDYMAMMEDADCCCGDESDYGKCSMHRDIKK